MVEDVDSTIIMANLIPNKNWGSNCAQILSTADISRARRNANDPCSIDKTGQNFMNTNASIINVDDGNCEVIPRHHYQSSDYAANGQKVEEIQCSIPSLGNNICKLFVKEKTPPKPRTEEKTNISNTDIATAYACTNQDEQQINETPDLQDCATYIEGNGGSKNNNESQEALTTISTIHSLSHLNNAECHKTEYKVEDHHLDVLCGLNQLRNDGSLLDVTLWAENQPFQVGNKYYYFTEWNSSVHIIPKTFFDLVIAYIICFNLF